MSRDHLAQTEYYKPKVSNISHTAHLTIFDGTSEPVEFDLTSFGKETVIFGRNGQNDIVLNSKYVSGHPHHGQFRFANGKWIIEDLKSTNGLIFNGKYIGSRVLEDGDSIRIDDGVDTTTDGVLMVFSTGSSMEWKILDLAKKAEITIGRDKNCNIRLNHISVSRLHAKIVAQGNAFYLIDNGSTNGVMVNGKKAEKKYLLQEKDLILITNSKLIFSGRKISYCCYKKGISVEALKIVKEVGKNRVICNSVDLSIQPCEMIAIVGGSGAGKSTVMNCLNGYSQPTKGKVVVNGVDLYENFDTLKHIIGYVPQSDIVYENLTVFTMLHYAAQLRLPKDVSESECLLSIEKVLKLVELTDHQDKLIKNLSGGQRKRASIAVELLSDPNLFFLDEPDSGLDPGTARNLMKTLQNMAASGKTVIFVTHSTLNLRLCDKIAFMGTGGNLCFYGSYAETLKFFGVDDIVNVYNLIANEPDKWKAR
ncbi:MAG: FHA domain-containing protein, partial [Prevotellaceae bacterium]|nr:FHA domain-containing protein [Prevotellaceae bacterium]